MFSRVILLGNLTRDCELRYLPNGGAVCTTSIATNRKFKKQDGSQGEEVLGYIEKAEKILRGLNVIGAEDDS